MLAQVGAAPALSDLLAGVDGGDDVVHPSGRLGGAGAGAGLAVGWIGGGWRTMGGATVWLTSGVGWSVAGADGGARAGGGVVAGGLPGGGGAAGVSSASHSR